MSRDRGIAGFPQFAFRRTPSTTVELCKLSRCGQELEGAREVAARFVVEGLWRHIGTVGPCNRPQFGIDRDPREVLGIAERLEDPAPLAGLEVDIADGSVCEGQPQA